MNFVELFCSTHGRVGRGLYWSCIGIWLLVDVLLRGAVSGVAAWSGNESIVALVFWTWVCFGVVTYFPLTALLIKRLHDIGRSGYWTVFQHASLASILMLFATLARMAAGQALMWILLIFVCAIGGLIVFVFTLKAGDDGSNAYGMAA
jgi:uncharacterized membrane protein YhaH (DUF805 family)